MADREGASKAEHVCADEESEILDLEGQGLTSIQLPSDVQPKTLILDNNDLTKLEGLNVCPGLSQLSAANNHIVHMTGLHMLNSLTVLSLSNNSIGIIEGIEGLAQLTWLDLSSNSIKVIENLPKGGQLHYLDLSDNDITHISDLSTQINLKTLLLHSNSISTLKSVSTCLPQSIGVLSLADNSVYDLNEISYLSSLPALQQLSISENPCVRETPNSKGFDYRPFVWNWCPSVQILDAQIITEKERLLGEWLYCQGKGRLFHPGEHVQLVTYLVNTCPLTSAEQLCPKEDSKFSQILSKQRFYQQQLQQQHHLSQQARCVTATNNLSSPPERHSFSAHHSETNSLDRISTSCSATSTHEHTETTSVWAKPADVRTLSHSGAGLHTHHANDLTLQDLSYDFDARSSVSLLESDSVYLPFDVPASPVILRRPFTAPEKKSHSSLVVTIDEAAKSFDPSTQQIQSREFKYDFSDQRPIHPLNHQTAKTVHKSTLQVAQPVSSNSVPKVSTHKESTLLTAQSEDYDSGSEPTASESEGISIDSLQSTAGKKSVNISFDSSQKPAPQDKLSHIKTVAGNKKVSTHKEIEVQEKPRAAARVKSGTNLIMKTLFSSTTMTNTSTTASAITASALARARMLKNSSTHIPGAKSVDLSNDTAQLNRERKSDDLSSDTTNLNRERKSDDLSSDVIKLNKSDSVETGASKLIKGKLNQEKMEQANIAGSVRVNKAATIIQTCWRGYRTRHFNAQVVSIRKEIRARRAEDHILLLRQDLERNRKLYEEEKHLRILQMEAIRLLYREVQDLKSRSLNSTDMSTSSTNTTVRFSSSVASTATADYSELNRTQELERTCAGLQSQVSQLQEALESVSSAVFKINSVDSANFDISDHSDRIRVNPAGENSHGSNLQSDKTSQWGCIPHSLSPYPSEEDDPYYLQVSARGAPTPPRHLQLSHYSHDSLMLSWQLPSCSGQKWEEEGNKHILGYKVYVNDQLKAFVCQRTSVLVEGLNPSTTYKFYVKALSGFGESFKSNIIMAKLAKDQERPKFPAESPTDSSQDSDTNLHSVDSNEKLKCKTRKQRKSPRSAEKNRSMKSAHHRRRQEALMDVKAETSADLNINNNCVIDNTECAILTQPKLHTHRRHRSRDHHYTDSKDCASETTSVESSPGAGTAVQPVDKNSDRYLNSLKSLNCGKLSQTEAGKETDLEETHKPCLAFNENIIFKKDTPTKVLESPPSGSRKQESPSSHRRKEHSSGQEIQKSCFHEPLQKESEIRQKTSPRSGTHIQISPPIGSAVKTGNESFSFSETYTISKGHSYLESVSAIAQSVLQDRYLGKHGNPGHKLVRSRDHQQHGSKSSNSTRSKMSAEQDYVSIEGDVQLGIGKHTEQTMSFDSEALYGSGGERSDSSEKVKGHKKSYNTDADFQITDSVKDVTGRRIDENKEESRKETSSKTEDYVMASAQPELKGYNVTLLNQPVIDGRRRLSSGSRPNSPVVSTTGGEKTRITVAELMMDQKLKSLNKSVSLNSLSGRTENGGSKLESSRRSPSVESLPSSSQGDTTQIVNTDSLTPGEISKRTSSSESLVSTLIETSKRSHSNESLSGTNRTDGSRRSPSNESLPGANRTDVSRRSPYNESFAENILEGTNKITASHTSKNPLEHQSLSESSASGCKRSKSMGSANDMSRKESRDSYSVRTNSLVSKLLLKLESISRNSSATYREKPEPFKLKKSDSDERECDASLSKPPSDDERRSAPRSRNLSDSDAEGRASDPGSQLPPRPPSDSLSGSHSDDNHQSSRSHRRTPSDHLPQDSSRHTHSPIIMEGGTKKKSSSMRRNQSFHGLLPSKHQDAKSSTFSNEESVSKNEELPANIPPMDNSSNSVHHIRSRTPSPRGRKPVLSAAQLKSPADKQ